MCYADWLLAAASQHNRVDPPDDKPQTCSKHVEAYRLFVFLALQPIAVVFSTAR
jgi:hypothetical protein